jgi:hypothetical protein
VQIALKIGPTFTDVTSAPWTGEKDGLGQEIRQPARSPGSTQTSPGASWLLKE